MNKDQERILELIAQIEWLMQRQDSISKETSAILAELNSLKAKTDITSSKDDAQITEPVQVPRTEPTVEEIREVISSAKAEQPSNIRTETPAQKLVKPKEKAIDFEKFVGENLINKIGIAITVIGVAIGAKYSIEHDLISPLTRIILGYLTSIGLLGFGIKLKKNYLNYSVVLVSGAIAIMYFLTFAAFSFYALIPQTLAFGSMVVLTGFAVVAALNYNKQVIAHIGLVGAYAIPFLLSTGSGNVLVLLTYISIINVGILIISFREYWKPVYYSAFGLSWVIYLSWVELSYHRSEHFATALSFLCIFFLTFYTVFAAYKLVKNEKFDIFDIIVLLANSFLFYGLGYQLLSGDQVGSQLLGLFTVLNALIHFGVSVLVYRKNLADPNLLRFVSGLVLAFITMAFPVQLDGNWVTLFWVLEAALLYWIGRSRNEVFYEKISFPLMALAVLSLAQDWTMIYDRYYYDDPASAPMVVFNINFLVSTIFGLCFGWIYRTSLKNGELTGRDDFYKGLQQAVSIGIPLMLLLLVYGLFRIEIVSFFNHLMVDTQVRINEAGLDSYMETNGDIGHFKSIWIINYSLMFLTAAIYLNLKKLKNEWLGQLLLLMNVLAVLVFLVQGLLEMSALRDSYLSPILNEHFEPSIFHILIRYVSYVFVLASASVSYLFIKQEIALPNFRRGFDVLLHVMLIWILSSELINWMDLAGSTQSYKLGLSILWGVYSLVLIVLGIRSNKKHLRIGALVLFAVTLLKLFLYDMMELGTIAKTIVFVSLGVLLLIISFLYNKYKDRIIDRNES